MDVSRIRKGFDRRAARYGNPLTTFIGERELRQIRRLVPPNSIVLDYGCGSGRTTLDLLQRGCRVTAFDISEAMLSRARRKAETLDLQAEFTLDKASLDDRRWPVITCIGVLDYYPDPLPLLSGLAQLLAPDGRLVVTYPNGLSPLAWFYTQGSRATVRAYTKTPAQARKAAQGANLNIESLYYAFPALPVLGHTLILSLIH